jgi:hypothetical protein
MPSGEDEEITMKLIKAGEELGVKVIDSVIIGDDNINEGNATSVFGNSNIVKNDYASVMGRGNIVTTKHATVDGLWNIATTSNSFSAILQMDDINNYFEVNDGSLYSVGDHVAILITIDSSNEPDVFETTITSIVNNTIYVDNLDICGCVLQHDYLFKVSGIVNNNSSGFTTGESNLNTGSNSIIAGRGNHNNFDNTMMLGFENRTSTDNQLILGQYNIGVNPNTLIEIGNGISDTYRINVLEVLNNGIIKEPTKK